MVLSVGVDVTGFQMCERDDMMVKTGQKRDSKR